jgi:hypothetical protein
MSEPDYTITAVLGLPIAEERLEDTEGTEGNTIYDITHRIDDLEVYLFKGGRDALVGRRLHDLRCDDDFAHYNIESQKPTRQMSVHDEVKQTLEPLGLWDESLYGLWIAVEYGVG